LKLVEHFEQGEIFHPQHMEFTVKFALKFKALMPILVVYTEEIPTGFGGMSYGPVVLLRPKYLNDEGLHAHELTHSTHWYLGAVLGMLAAVLTLNALFILAGIAIYPILYEMSDSFRKHVEAQCYREQFAKYPPDRNVFWAVSALATKYDLNLTIQEASDLLMVDMNGNYRPR